MAKKKHKKLQNKKIEIIEMVIVVDMTDRYYMNLRLPDNIETKEEEIIKLQKLAKKETDEIKQRYFSTNLQITQTMQRTFIDLVKRFFEIKAGQTPNSMAIKKG